MSAPAQATSSVLTAAAAVLSSGDPQPVTSVVAGNSSVPDEIPLHSNAVYPPRALERPDSQEEADDLPDLRNQPLTEHASAELPAVFSPWYLCANAPAQQGDTFRTFAEDLPKSCSLSGTHTNTGR